MKGPSNPFLNLGFEFDMIENCKRLAPLCPAFVMVATLLSSCGGDSGEGGGGQGQERGNAISETTTGEEWAGNNSTREDDNTWYRHCFADDTSVASPSIRAGTPYGNEVIVKMRKSSGEMQDYSVMMEGGMHDRERLDRVVERINRRHAAMLLHPLGSSAIGDGTSGDLLSVKRPMSGGAAVVEVSTAANSVAGVVEELTQEPEIEYAELNYKVQSSAIEQPDVQHRDAWYLHNVDAGIRIDQAWRVTQGVPGAVTAVLDTGVTSHPNLVSHLLPGYNFVTDSFAENGSGRGSDVQDPGDWIGQDESGAFAQTVRNSSWHGTSVAGVVAATMSMNGWEDRRQARILPVRVLGKGGGRTSDVVDGMRWAAGLPVVGVPENPHPAKVVNLSLGSVGVCSRTFQEAVDDLVEQGVTVVAAAGNDGVNEIDAPANCRGVISVAGSDPTGRRVSDSNTHPRVTLSAPGTKIWTLSNTGKQAPADASYGYMHGTSLAAPQVSGVVSLMLATNPWLTPSEVASILKRTARFTSIVSTTRSCRVIPPGRGILDAQAAVSAAAAERNSGGQ
ncbi:S8 family peptidase [Burkholderia sp. BE17]|uniref:S8 family peptidase n=1 Tax=Burkholderia sp. BE17 TaxID=2656644 RepID=UPI00128C0675|nr:S8 family peptidase [Burkholderia sp. BE17]MPV69153.1 S8 family serine peptidase [Burkholderia sp. BE17]